MDQLMKVGVIGCGAIAQRRHLPEYAVNPLVVIEAVSDPNIERAKDIASKYSVANAFADYKDLLAIKELDAVSICVPNHLHAEVTIEALRAGKHVLCEKPMATSVADAERMVETAKETGRLLLIGYNQRFMPAHRKARDILRSGVLGKVLTFESVFGHKGPENWSVDGKNSWFFDERQAFFGALGDLGVHKADLVYWLLEEPFTKVFAMTETRHKSGAVDDNSILLIQTTSGVIGTITVSWTYYPHEINKTIIRCEKGTLRVGDDPEFSVIVDYADGNQELYRVGRIASNSADGQTHSGIIDHFVDCITYGVAPECSGTDAMHAMRTIMEAVQFNMNHRR